MASRKTRHDYMILSESTMTRLVLIPEKHFRHKPVEVCISHGKLSINSTFRTLSNIYDGFLSTKNVIIDIGQGPKSALCQYDSGKASNDNPKMRSTF